MQKKSKQNGKSKHVLQQAVGGGHEMGQSQGGGFFESWRVMPQSEMVSACVFKKRQKKQEICEPV